MFTFTLSGRMTLANLHPAAPSSLSFEVLCDEDWLSGCCSGRFCSWRISFDFLKLDMSRSRSLDLDRSLLLPDPPRRLFHEGRRLRRRLGSLVGLFEPIPISESRCLRSNFDFRPSEDLLSECCCCIGTDPMSKSGSASDPEGSNRSGFPLISATRLSL